MLTFSSPPQVISGPRGEAVDQHRWQNHGHHGQGSEAPPPLRAGCCTNPHLHADEEGRWGLCCRPSGARKPLPPQAPRKFFRGGGGDAMWLLLCWCWDAESSTVSSTCPLGRNLLEPPELSGWGGPVVDAVCVFLGASYSAVVVLAIMTLIMTVLL